MISLPDRVKACLHLPCVVNTLMPTREITWWRNEVSCDCSARDETSQSCSKKDRACDILHEMVGRFPESSSDGALHLSYRKQCFARTIRLRIRVLCEDVRLDA